MAVTEPSSTSPRQLDRINLAITFLNSGLSDPPRCFDASRFRSVSEQDTGHFSASCPGHRSLRDEVGDKSVDAPIINVFRLAATLAFRLSRSVFAPEGHAFEKILIAKLATQIGQRRATCTTPT